MNVLVFSVPVSRFNTNVRSLQIVHMKYALKVLVKKKEQNKINKQKPASTKLSVSKNITVR